MFIGCIGGESTGKSTLARALALETSAVELPEVLREWVDLHGRTPRADEQRAIMERQRQREIQAFARAGTGDSVVTDAMPLMTAVYSQLYFSDKTLLADALLWAADYDLIAWCRPDFPWASDDQRDGPEFRERADQLLASLVAQHPELPVLPVQGSTDERVNQVLSALDRAP